MNKLSQDTKYWHMGITNIDLQRAVITIFGGDAYKFLQGIITNDLAKVTEQNAIYTYLLTPQGKYLFDFFISKQGEKFYIEVAERDKDDLLKKLKMYKLRSAVEIEDISQSVLVATAETNTGYIDPRSNKMPNRIIREKLNAQASSNIEEYNKLRIENNIPEGDDLEKDKSYPLHYRMIELNGVDFDKGCYVGQEVTTRTHRRGEIRKTIYKISASSPLLKGAEVTLHSSNIGRIITVSGNAGLALLEKEAAENATSKLVSGNSELTIIS